MSFFKRTALYVLLPVFITVCLMGIMQYRTLSGIQCMYQADEVIVVFEKMKQLIQKEYQRQNTTEQYTGELKNLNDSINRHLLMFEELQLMSREIRLMSIISSSAFPLLLIVVIIIGILYLTRNLFKPIHRLTDAIEAYTNGESDVFPIPVSGSPESRVLTETTNTMVGTIVEQKRRIALQSKFLGWRSAALEIAHEIKNRLVPAKLSSETVLETAIDTNNVTLKTDIKRVLHSLSVLEKMSKSIRDLSGMRTPQPETVDLYPIVTESVVFYRKQFPAICFSGESCELSADRVLMRSVFDNIILNAIEAVGDREGGAIEVVLKGGKDAVFICTDNGPGIDEALLDKIFKLNFTTKEHGTGFGLYFVKKVVEDHGFLLECISGKKERTTVIKVAFGGKNSNR